MAREDNLEDVTASDQSHVEVLDLEDSMFSGPRRVDVEPVQHSGTKGVWVCDVKHLNVLKLNGQDIEPSSRVMFRSLEIAWTPRPGAEQYTTACPTSQSGGVFQRVKLYGLVFGLASNYVGCRPDFAIDGNRGPAWVAVNDTNYADSDGFVRVQVSWR